MRENEHLKHQLESEMRQKESLCKEFEEIKYVLSQLKHQNEELRVESDKKELRIKEDLASGQEETKQRLSQEESRTSKLEKALKEFEKENEKLKQNVPIHY